jgi:hypothetical protein
MSGSGALSRRRLLTGTGVLAASTGAGLLVNPVSAQECLTEPSPSGGGWSGSDFSLPAGHGGPRKILEIFLYGGLSPWESFYAEPASRTTGGLDAAYNGTSIIDACRITGPLASDTQGGMCWSRATEPLRSMAGSAPAMLARTRVVAMSHGVRPELEARVHPLAVPLALTGRRFGDARGCSLGTAMKHKYPGVHTSYVLMPPLNRFFSAADRASFDVWFSTGLHGCAPPVLVPMESLTPALNIWAGRRGVDSGIDALVEHYAALYETSLGGSRARRFDAYRTALRDLPSSPSLQCVFGSPLRTSGVADTPHCATGSTTLPSNLGTTAACLDMAAWLFREKGARYVGMVDVGIGRLSGSAYDGHTDCALGTFGNLYRLLKELTRVITESPTPGPGRIGLDEAMIILNTEFGRAPQEQNLEGRDHFARGYTTVLIGGPIGDAGPRLVGSFDRMGDDFAGQFTPGNLMAASLMAMGINPDLPENLAANDVYYDARGAAVALAPTFFA